MKCQLAKLKELSAYLMKIEFVGYCFKSNNKKEMDASLRLEGGIRFIFISEEIYCYLYI